MSKENKPEELYSSKVKNLLIELHDYRYFHSPSEIDNVDKRFFGREKIRERLKNVLTNSETKSGSYLITGFRGMGKSSFVSQVLSRLNFNYHNNKLISHLR